MVRGASLSLQGSREAPAHVGSPMGGPPTRAGESSHIPCSKHTMWNNWILQLTPTLLVALPDRRNGLKDEVSGSKCVT